MSRLGGLTLRRLVGLTLGVAVGLGLTACGTDNSQVKADYPSGNDGTWGTYDNRGAQGEGVREQSLFGADGMVLLGGPDYDPGQGDGAGIGVNSFLWRASLDTLSFMPLTSADPFGGVIITDWYTPPQTPGERFKISAFILDRSLRADGVRIAAFRQIEQSPGNWVDSGVGDTMATDLENTILTRARQLRIRTLASQ